MLPLRFPNSGIRDKRRQQRRRVVKAPYKGAAGCGQGQPKWETSGTRKGRRLQAEESPTGTTDCGQPVGATTAHGYDRLRPARRGDNRPREQPLAARRPPLGWPALSPAGAMTPAVGVAAPWQGGCQRARVAVACAGPAVVTMA
ncbi:hypothetical protein GW17_00006899 [Ensete ventricosum]|nr:hypothetical protein GW17_00006899 [Ensete ventricosum]